MQYLLGSLPAEESERMDELSVTDDEFAWRLREAENDLVDAYVRHELSGKTLEGFRAFYLASPRRQEKVAFAEDLLRFQASAASVSARAPDKSWSNGSFLSRIFASRRMVLPFAVAALAIMVVFGYLIFDNARLRNEMNSTRAEKSLQERINQELERALHEQRAANADAQKSAEPGGKRTADLDQLKMLALVLPLPARGLGPIKTVTVHPNADLMVLLLTLESADFPRYRVMLKDPGTNEVLWRSDDLETATGDKPALTVSFRTSLLKTQNYVAEVSGFSRSGQAQIVGDYAFHVVVK
jgi:hypothetical protein